MSSNVARRDEVVVVVDNDTDDRWLTTEQAAAFGGMSRAALLKAVERGRIVPDSPARKGWTRAHRFRKATISRYLRGGSASGQEG